MLPYLYEEENPRWVFTLHKREQGSLCASHQVHIGWVYDQAPTTTHTTLDYIGRSLSGFGEADLHKYGIFLSSEAAARDRLYKGLKLRASPALIWNFMMTFFTQPRSVPKV